MSARTPSVLMSAARRFLPRAGWAGNDKMADGVVTAAIRHMGDVIGSGEGKGGGSGGSIRSAGGSIGKRSVTQEEEFFKREQAREIAALKKNLKAMKDGKIAYHQRQMERHLTQIKKHEELMLKDKDPKHKLHIESHKESAEAHKQYIQKLDKGGKQ